LAKTVLLLEAGVFSGERLLGRRGGLRLPLSSLVGKQLPAAVLDGGK
jgi:hypothetical protein